MSNDDLANWARWLQRVGLEMNPAFPSSIIPAAVVLGAAMIASSKLMADALWELANATRNSR